MSNSNDNDVSDGPRIVSRREDRREGVSARGVAPAAETTTSVSSHIYEVVSKPSACTKYDLGDYIELYVSDPAPQNVIVQLSGSCNGMEATLVE